MTLGGRTFPGIADEGIKQGPRANAGREGTPVLTVVNPDDSTPATGPVSSDGSLIDEIVRDCPGGCSPPLSRLRSPRMSPGTSGGSTTMAGGWWCATVTLSRGGC